MQFVCQCSTNRSNKGHPRSPGHAWKQRLRLKLRLAAEEFRSACRNTNPGSEPSSQRVINVSIIKTNGQMSCSGFWDLKKFGFVFHEGPSCKIAQFCTTRNHQSKITIRT